MKDKEGVFGVCVDAILFSLPNSKALIRAISLAFGAEVLGRRILIFTTPLRLTIAYPAFQMSSSMNLLPCVYHSSSGLSKGVSFKSGLIGYTYSIVFVQ